MMGIKVSKEEIGNVVRRVLTYYMRKRTVSQAADQTLFLVPEFPIGLTDVLAEYELYGELETVAFFLDTKDAQTTEVPGNRIYYRDRKEDVNYIMNSLSMFGKLEIYAPSFDFLRELKEGKEGNIFVRIAVYFLMTGKPAVVRLPYSMETVPDGKFGKKIRDLMEDLWDMGISFAGLVPGFEEFAKLPDEAKVDLVTEKVVEQYHESGYRQIHAASGALVTPLARERAKELNIQIIT